MADINHAIKVNKPKVTEIKNSTLYWWKGYVYQDLRDKERAAATLKTAYQLAQKDNPEYVSVIAFNYAQALYALDDLAGADVVYRKMLADDESDAIYRQMVKEDETDQAAMTGLARNMIQREDYPASYRTLLQVYDKKGETNNAIDAAIEYVDKDSDPSWRLLINAGKKNLNYAVSKCGSR